MNIEATIFASGLPVNTHPMLARLHELLEEHHTNCLSHVRDDWRVKAVLWLIMQQVFGQIGTIEMDELWRECYQHLQSTAPAAAYVSAA